LARADIAEIQDTGIDHCKRDALAIHCLKQLIEFIVTKSIKAEIHAIAISHKYNDLQAI
jgi:hypothetical protein